MAEVDGYLPAPATAPASLRDAVQWFLWDAEITCPDTGLPEVIRQAETLAEALAGIDADF